MARRPLTDRDRAILEFERVTWRHLGAKESEILDRFGVLAPVYYQTLTQLLEHPDAEAYDAQLVRRLRDLRDQRQGARRRGSAVLADRR